MTRRARLGLTVGTLGAGLVGASCSRHAVTTAPGHASAYRTEILDVSDSTFRFLTTGLKWVRIGTTGIAVDPRRRDALVARFVVQSRVADTAQALVTGETARVTTTHVALLDAPRRHTAAQGTFWLGVVLGGVIGAATALVAR